ncbi:MAG: preprotein translocase subunit SecY, partial [Lachnospiraceae bacterium]|nr:preprotein translocase subunit SecY [Lachnospiraceae bacterium]
TRKYIFRKLTILCIMSATIMSICIGIPMILQLTGRIDDSLVALPSTAMLIAGLWCNIHQEIKTISNFDSYEVFL